MLQYLLQSRQMPAADKHSKIWALFHASPAKQPAIVALWGLLQLWRHPVDIMGPMRTTLPWHITVTKGTNIELRKYIRGIPKNEYCAKPDVTSKGCTEDESHRRRQDPDQRPQPRPGDLKNGSLRSQRPIKDIACWCCTCLFLHFQCRHDHHFTEEKILD